MSPKVHCWYFPDLFLGGANKYVEETLLLKPVLASLLEKSGVSADVLVAIKPQRARVVYMVVAGVESSNGTYEPFPFEKGWTPSTLFKCDVCSNSSECSTLNALVEKWLRICIMCIYTYT